MWEGFKIQKKCGMHIAHLLPVQRKKIHRKRLIFQSWRKENHAPNICLLFVKGDDLALKTKNKVNTEKGGFCVLFVPLWNKTRVKRSRSKCTFLWDYSLITDSKLIRTKGPKAKWKYNTIHHHILWRYPLRLLRFVHEWCIGIRKGGLFFEQTVLFSTQKRVHCRTSLKMKACFSPTFAEFSL